MPLIAPDTDHDGDVDDIDSRTFKACMGRAEVPAPRICADYDYDADSDVDPDDYGVFQRCYSGENVLLDPECLPSP